VEVGEDVGDCGGRACHFDRWLCVREEVCGKIVLLMVGY
jgi:hypothetical protein